MSQGVIRKGQFRTRVYLKWGWIRNPDKIIFWWKIPTFSEAVKIVSGGIWAFLENKFTPNPENSVRISGSDLIWDKHRSSYIPSVTRDRYEIFRIFRLPWRVTYELNEMVQYQNYKIKSYHWIVDNKSLPNLAQWPLVFFAWGVLVPIFTFINSQVPHITY